MTKDGKENLITTLIILLVFGGMVGFFALVAKLAVDRSEHLDNKPYIERDLMKLGVSEEKSGYFFLIVGQYEEDEYVKYMVDNGDGNYIIRDKDLEDVQFNFTKDEDPKMLCKEEKDFNGDYHSTSGRDCIFKVPRDAVKRTYNLENSFN